MSVTNLVSAWTQLKAFCSRSAIASNLENAYALRFGLAWDNKHTRAHEPLDVYCASMKLLPCKAADAKLNDTLLRLAKSPFEEKSATVNYDVLLFTRTRTSPLLARLAGNERLSHCLVFPREDFSHLYLATRMDEFASTFFPVLYARHSIKSNKRQAGEADAKNVCRRELDYAVLPEETVVCVHAEKSVLLCFLGFLASEYFEFPKARFDFLFSHLPLNDNTPLSMAVLLSTLCAPREIRQADEEKFRAFAKGGDVGFPESVHLRTGRLSTEAAAYEVPLVWLKYTQQAHDHDVSNTCRHHRFELDAQERKEQTLGLELALMATEEKKNS